MRFTRVGAASVSLVVALAMHQGAMAQTNDGDALMALDNGALKGEIQMRFDAALAASNNSTVVSADDTRFIWANEAKAQCGIALGYLKSGTKDPVSVRKCARAYQLMQDGTRRGPIAPRVEPPPAECEAPKLIFFPWNERVPAAGDNTAQEVVSYVQQNSARCGWNAYEVVGHADLSGTPTYNIKLAQDRADYVKSMLESAMPTAPVSAVSRGESEPRIPTEDGVREPGNRRVEIRGRQ